MSFVTRSSSSRASSFNHCNTRPSCNDAYNKELLGLDEMIDKAVRYSRLEFKLGEVWLNFLLGAACFVVGTICCIQSSSLTRDLAPALYPHLWVYISEYLDRG